MKQYVIPDFSKGLVDIDSQAKVDKTYKQKCSELLNFYIATDNTLKRRPPLVESTLYPEATGAIDFVISENRHIFLCNVPPDELAQLPAEVQGVLSPTGDAVNYTQTEEGLRASFQAQASAGQFNLTVDWQAKVNAQRLVVYNRETNEHLPEEGYLFVTVYHDSSTTYRNQVTSLCGALAREVDPDFPRRLDITEIEEPAAFFIFKNGVRVASSHTMPYKYDDQIKPPLKTAIDNRYATSSLLRQIETGQSEFLFATKERCVEPIRQLDRHIKEGITFSYAGLRYRLSDNRLQGLTSRKLLPGITDMTAQALKTLFPRQEFEAEVTLPAKVVYIPASADARTNRVDFPYARDTFTRALTTDLQTTTENTGNTYALESLLNGNRTAAFSLTAFRGIHPELSSVVDNLKLVVSAFQTGDGAQWMYPDIKYLSGGADHSRVGEASFLYRTQNQDRTAVVVTSMKEVGWNGPDEEALSRDSFPNGNGYAADGVGVCIALYKHLPNKPDKVNPTELEPDGFLYFFLDYDRPEVQDYFKESDLVSGYSSAYNKYRGFVLKKGSPATTRPSDTIVNILLDSMNFYNGEQTTRLGDNPLRANFIQDVAVSPSVKTGLAWPIGLTQDSILKFATPCYAQSLNPLDATLTEIPTDNAFGGHRFQARSAETPFLNTEARLILYLHSPKLYTGSNYNYETLPGRDAVYFDNILYLSQVLETEVFNNHIVDYFLSVVNNTRDARVLRVSGLGGQLVAPIEGDPQVFRFKSRLGGRDDIVTVEGADQNNIYIGTQNGIKRALPGTFLQQVRMSDVSKTGLTTPIISESSYNVAAAGNRLVLMRYYEEAQGVIADLLAPETTLFLEADGVEQLLSKYKLLFFYKRGANRVYCGSMDKERGYKGVSEFLLPANIHTMKQINQDTVGLLLTDGRYCEMDFAATTDTDFRDSLGGKKLNYTSSLTSLPVVFVGEQSFSSTRTLAITKASIGIAGFASFDFSVLDDITGVEQTTPVRFVDDQNITEPKRFGGFWSLETLPTNGAVSPRIRIVKKDNKYMALSSVILEVS